MNGTHTIDPCCGNDACVVPPAEFVRLRYFFGQRLGVLELADEQSYLIGKQRFHNLRAHGVGVLCGLLADRFVFPQGSPASTATTLLRVHRGAALDGCGREIVVGWDQCIDVAAWFAQHPDAAGALGEERRLWVAVCYRECPSDPAPAPRDPCGCDAGGCEHARVREGFELKLLTDAEASLYAPKDNDSELAPSGYRSALYRSYGRAVALLVGAGCPEPVADPCLLLANFQVTLDATGTKVVDISAPDNTIPERRSLLPTHVLQQALLQALAGAGNAELLGEGPRLGQITFTGGGADYGTLVVEVETDGEALTRDPLDSEQMKVTVARFQDDGSWDAAPDFTATYVAGPPAGIEIKWASGLVHDGRYRVLIESDRAKPPVDKQMRPLTPPAWARHFRLVKNAAGKLALADTLYS